MIASKSTSPWPRETRVPAAAGVAEFDVRAENTRAVVAIDLHILQMHVVNPIREIAQEDRGIHALPEQVASDQS